MAGKKHEEKASSVRAESSRTPASREMIAARAYQLYMRRGGGAGHELDDWLQAEAEIDSGERRSRPERAPSEAVAPA
jgi:hypothetical protein